MQSDLLFLLVPPGIVGFALAYKHLWRTKVMQKFAVCFYAPYVCVDRYSGPFGIPKRVRMKDCTTIALDKFVRQRNFLGADPVRVTAAKFLIKQRIRKVLHAPLSEMPLYINDEYHRIAFIARKRLEGAT